MNVVSVDLVLDNEVTPSQWHNTVPSNKIVSTLYVYF